METKTDTLPDLVVKPGESAGAVNAAPSPPRRADSNVIRNALTSESFIEKAAMLLLTAGLTGLLAPWIINHFNAKETERQKELEARKARDASILQAQSKLLDEAAEVILTYEMLALDVSWYKHPLGANEELYRKAFERYSERVVDLFAKWRTFISRSRTLASPAVSVKLDLFFERVIKEQDTPICVLVRKNAPGPDWEAMHRKSESMLHEADVLITELAKDMRLSKDDLHQ